MPKLLTLLPSAWRLPVQPGQTLLEAADAAGVRLPRSCRNGTCRECRCKLVSGEVRYRIEWPGLSVDERDDGWILPCVALPLGDVTLLQHRAERGPMPGEPSPGPAP
ncbi:MAG: 2Fe-2S iron-sulfur cluster-binding protein [Pseudomonadota bacterium]